MTLRQRIIKRVEYSASLHDMALGIERVLRETSIMPRGIDFVETYLVDSKAEADRIIERYGPAATPLWRNGIYMAKLDPSKLPVEDGRPPVPHELASGTDAVIFEIHFAPPITDQAA